MGTVPTARTFVAGETETAAFMNSVSAGVNFILDPPRVKVYQSATTTSLTTAVYTGILFNAEYYDSDSMHDTVTNSGRLTVATPGLYELYAHIPIQGNATGNRFLNLFQNGAALGEGIYGGPVAGTGTWVVEAETEVFGAVGDYFEVAAYQNSGGPLTTISSGGYRPIFRARWVARS